MIFSYFCLSKMVIGLWNGTSFISAAEIQVHAVVVNHSHLKYVDGTISSLKNPIPSENTSFDIKDVNIVIKNTKVSDPYLKLKANDLSMVTYQWLTTNTFKHLN